MYRQSYWGGKERCEMIGFIKWIIQQYKAYKICETFEPLTEEREKLIMKNYARCLELGCTPEQLIALMNLMYAMKGGIK